MKSHATSWLAHALFLALAFSAPPVVGLLDTPATPVTGRVVEFRQVAPPPVPRRVQWEKGEGPGKGIDEPLRPDPLAKVGPADDSDEPSLAAVTPTDFEALTGALAGVAEETVGPDTEIALGKLDGGGGGKDFGFGWGSKGRGRSCETVLVTDPKTEVVRVKELCDRAITAGLGAIRGMLGRAGGMRREFSADLGERTELPRCAGGDCIEVAMGRPRSCAVADRPECRWKEALEEVVRRHRREIRDCWERTLRRRRRETTAEMVLSFSLPPVGGTAEVSIGASSGIEAFDECIEQRASRWEFPPPGARIVASYPLRFWTR